MLHPSRYGESKCISGDIEQCRTIEIPHSKSIGTVDRSIKGRAKITRTLVCLRFVFYLSHPSLLPPSSQLWGVLEEVLVRGGYCLVNLRFTSGWPPSKQPRTTT